jgi:hypothetical protein
MREAMHARKTVFFMHRACCYAQVLGMKKKVEIWAMQHHWGKFCPPAAALPELMWEN